MVHICLKASLRIAIQAVNVLTRLEPNPYPEDRTLLLITQSVEVLATGNRRVPLTEVKLP